VRGVPTRTGRIVEIVSLLVIAFAVAIGGRALLLMMMRFRLPSIVVLVVIIAGTIGSIRRSYRDAAFARLLVSKALTYFAAVALALWLLAAPQRWLYGATIAATEIAIALELVVAIRPPLSTKE